MPAPATTARLVARRAEWEALWSALERAARGESAAAVVAGEAGVGKSRLVEELARSAEGQGMRVLVGRCVDIGDGELPYAPIAGALRGLLFISEKTVSVHVSRILAKLGAANRAQAATVAHRLGLA